MITPSYGLTATERVLPRMALDFTTATLDPRVTFTRTGNTATVVNSSGFVASINADLPRFDFNPTTLVCNGLLIEEARTNLFTYSEDFSDASWVKSNATITTDAVVSPSNVQNADKIVEAATTGSHFFEKVVAVTSGTLYTWSGFFKAGERPSVSLTAFTNANHTATFNLITGTASTPVNATSAITNFGNGWYRCSITLTSGSTGTGFFDTYINNGTSASYAGNGTSGIYAWGAQLEAGAFATSYIPTTTASLTRNADVATMTGTNFSSWFNASEGAIVAQAARANIPVSNSTNILAISDGTSSNRSRIWIWAGNPSQLAFTCTASGAGQADMNPGSVTANVTFNVAGAYKLNDFATARNAGAVVTDTSGIVPIGLNVLNIGAREDLIEFLNGHIKKIAYYPQRLTNSELQAFTK